VSLFAVALALSPLAFVFFVLWRHKRRLDRLHPRHRLPHQDCPDNPCPGVFPYCEDLSRRRR
jgi:hypothetical protein